MEEFFINDYVVKVESGHPGYIHYTIIAQPETWRSAAHRILAKVESQERAPVPDSRRKPRNETEFLLLHERASISRGKTSRVSISFCAAENLDAHHVRFKTWKRFWVEWSWLFFLLFSLIVLYLAGVGFLKIIGDFTSK